MLVLSLFRALSSAARLWPRSLDVATQLAARILAHALNMPEPLVHTTGVYVVAQVQAAEQRAAASFSLLRLRRRARALLRLTR